MVGRHPEATEVIFENPINGIVRESVAFSPMARDLNVEGDAFVTIEPLRNLAKRLLPARAQQIVERWVVAVRRFRPRRKFSFSQRPAIASESPYPFPVAPDNVLAQLGEKYTPSKRLHNYLPFYWMHFRDIRFEVKRVLEIGVQTDRSIRMWEELIEQSDEPYMRELAERYIEKLRTELRRKGRAHGDV